MRRPILAFVAVIALAGCASESSTTPEKQAAAPSAGMVPITSKSEDAVAQFRKGEMLAVNSRVSEAAAAFEEALKLDPDFVLAHAYHGSATPGPDGLKELESAHAAASKLPEAERLYIDGLLGARRNDNTAARAAFTRLTQVAPSDWRGFFGLGTVALNETKYSEAVGTLKKAIEKDPKAAASAQNLVGYAALRQDDTQQAIAAFREYARALPDEPNPQDSLGEALLGAGQFKDAEAAFQKALQLSPQFWNAHQGMAYARFYGGDWAGGREALVKAGNTATRRADKIGIRQEMAAAAVAQRNMPEALKLLDEAERTEGAQPTEIAYVPVNRTYTLIEAGKLKDAAASADKAAKMAESGTFPPGFSRALHIEALRARISAEATAGDANAAKATSAALDADASSRPDDPVAQSAMHYGRAMMAVARGDLAEAKMHFAQCAHEDDLCTWRGMVTAQKTKDSAGADAARTALLKTLKRDPLYLVIWSRVAAPKTS